MTPKEKAKELVDKFDEFTVHYEWREKNDNAIECALVAVDGMYDIASENNNVQQMNYLVDVKKEIKKL